MLNQSTQCVFIALLALSLSSCGGNTRVKPDEPAPVINSGAQIKAPIGKEQPLKEQLPTKLLPSALAHQPKKIALLVPM